MIKTLVFLSVLTLSASVFATEIPADLTALFNKVDNCGGNDNGSISTFNVDTFDAAAAMAKLRARDTENRGAGCSEGRTYSRSRAEGAGLFKEFLASDDDADQCLSDGLTRTEFRQLLKVISDPTNLAVLASMYGGSNDNAEACTYYNFVIYRADGVRLAFTFNYTD
jgi:hypothetical protein